LFLVAAMSQTHSAPNVAYSLGLCLIGSCVLLFGLKSLQGKKPGQVESKAKEDA
jgi:hypothetical protein